MITASLPTRKQDQHGSGEWHAPRGDHTHNGVDLVSPVGAELLAPVTGLVTKLGYPYADDLAFRYVQITVAGGDAHRLFYIEPLVEVGDQVEAGITLVGIQQDLEQRYPGITNHVHYEIKRGDDYISPTEVLV